MPNAVHIADVCDLLDGLRDTMGELSEPENGNKVHSFAWFWTGVGEPGFELGRRTMCKNQKAQGQHRTWPEGWAGEKFKTETLRAQGLVWLGDSVALNGTIHKPQTQAFLRIIDALVGSDQIQSLIIDPS